MDTDTQTAIQTQTADATANTYNVSVLKKQQDTQKLQGQLSVRLIDQSGPQMTKTADGHISVRA